MLREIYMKLWEMYGISMENLQEKIPVNYNMTSNHVTFTLYAHGGGGGAGGRRGGANVHRVFFKL